MRRCKACQMPLAPEKRSDAKYCSNACRQWAYRQRNHLVQWGRPRGRVAWAMGMMDLLFALRELGVWDGSGRARNKPAGGRDADR